MACAQAAEPWPAGDRLFHQDPRWLGADAAYSVDMGDGRVLWLFGDSFVSPHPAKTRVGSSMPRNTIAIETGYDPSRAMMHFYWREHDGNASSFFAEEHDDWLWPLDGICSDHRLLLFFNVIRADHSPGSLGFRGLHSIAFLVMNANEAPLAWRLRKMVLPNNRWNITLGVAVLREQKYLYIYGFDEPRHDIYLARTSASQAMAGDLSGMEWWLAREGQHGEWIRESDRSLQPTPVFRNGATELSIHWDRNMQRYVEIQSVGFGASEIAARSAGHLQGPWSPLQVIYRPPESNDPHPFVYAAKAHPELRGDGLLITYAANGSEQRLATDMSIYFPRFVRAHLGSKSTDK